MTAVEPLVQRAHEPDTHQPHLSVVPAQFQGGELSEVQLAYLLHLLHQAEAEVRSLLSRLDRVEARITSQEAKRRDARLPDSSVEQPARLNYAGWCLWCSGRHCTKQTCIDRHQQSRWDVCPDCDGLGGDDATSTPCSCAHGLMQVR